METCFMRLNLLLLTVKIAKQRPNTQLTTFDSENSKIKQFNPRLVKSDKQNSKAERPKVPPRCSSLTYSRLTCLHHCKLTKLNILPQIRLLGNML